MPYKDNSDIGSPLKKAVATVTGTSEPKAKYLTKFREILANVMKKGIKGEKVPEGRAIQYTLGALKQIKKNEDK
jgi:hypothetical protein